MNGNLKDALRRGPGCPPMEELLEGGKSAASHAETCPGCQAELTLYGSFETPPSKDELEAVAFIEARLKPVAQPSLWSRLVGARSFSPSGLGGLVLAAAAVIFAVGVASQWRDRRSDTVSESQGAVLRSTTIRVLTPLENLTSAPAEIRWVPVDGAALYEVSVAEVDRSVIFHKTFTAPVLSVPADLATLLVPGKTLSFRVTARDASGKELASSGPLSLRVELPGR
jgi:hypothetical protein